MKAKFIIFGIVILEILFLSATRQMELNIFQDDVVCEVWEDPDYVEADEIPDVEMPDDDEIREDYACPDEFIVVIDGLDLTGQERRFGHQKNFNVQNGHLNLSSQRLNDLPSSILDEGCITSLDLENNRIVAFPFGVQRLGDLSYLSLANNKIRKIESFGHLTSLKHLDLSYNEITELPYSIGYMQDLEHLNLSGNYNLDMLPVSNLQKLANLRVLNLKHTKIKKDKKFIYELQKTLSGVNILY